MYRYKLNLISLNLLLAIKFVLIQICTGQSHDCTFPHNEGNKNEPTISVDIWNAVKGKSYAYKTPSGPEQYTYQVGICTPVVDLNGDVGAMQTKQSDSSSVNLGRITHADFIEGKGWLMLQYFDGDNYHSSNHCNKGNRSTTVMITCKKDETAGDLILTEEVNEKAEHCYYLFELFIDVACQVEEASGGTSGLSAGSISVIVFLSLVAIYLLFGFLYQRFVKGAQGKEQLPNYTFWKELGNLVADGCNLVFRSDEYSEPRQYRGISGDNLPGNQDIERESGERDDQLLNM